MEGVVELGTIERFVLLRAGVPMDIWLERGFSKVPPERVMPAIFQALQGVSRSQLSDLWKGLLGRPCSSPELLDQLLDALTEAASEPCSTIHILERRIARGSFFSSPELPKGPPPPQRTETEHFIVVEAVNEQDRPVPGVRLELLVAGGEVRGAQTGADGIARVERIKAGRVGIRLPYLDASMWEPVDGGGPAEPSGGEERFRWHTVERGECLSKIAHRYGIKSYKLLWEHPKNAPLKQKRKSPHVLLPGDAVAVPAVKVAEIVRPTDASYRIRVSGALVTFRVVLQDHNQLPFRGEPYELRTSTNESEDPRKGSTDGAGTVIEQLAPTVSRVEIFVPTIGLTWSFSLSDLPPIPDKKRDPEHAARKAEEPAVKAVQARLNALGFPCGAVDGRLGPRTRAALALFDGKETEHSTDQSPQPLEDTLLARLDQSFEVVG